MRLKTKLLYALAIPLVAQAPAAHAQWTNRYPKLANASHHVYLEGYNLPTMAQSPTDPAISPDGKTVAFSARGWLWTMNVATRQAKRLTKGKDMDFRPAWSPDGKQIAFIRDTSSDTTIMAVEVASGQERTLVDTKGMDLDPAFSPDGKTLFYSSAEAGDLDIWRMDLASGAKTRLTTDRGQELNPQPINGGAGIAFVAKGRGDGIDTLTLGGDKPERKTLLSDSLVPQMRIASSPNGQALAAIVLDDDRWKLIAMGSKGGDTVRLAADAPAPEAPSWSTTGEIWFVQPNRDKQFTLYRTSDTGGPIEDMTPLEWDLGEPTARVTIRTRQSGAAVAARLSVVDGAGHPVAPDRGSVARFDGQHGVVFFHSPGTVTLEVPAGALKVKGTHGFDGVAEATRTVVAGQTTVIDLDLPSTGFNAQARGWYSGDLHNHLNYGGAYQLIPEDMVDEMRAEDLDVATPMLANLQTTLIDTKYAMWQRTTPPLIEFAQEVRPNVGHVGLVGANQLFTPWFYGPNSPGYSQANLMNGDPLQFARKHGGLAVYVHPVMRQNPFPTDGSPPDVGTAMVSDMVMGDVDTIEVACLWSDELGSAEAWYRALNLGLPITATAGSDTMHNFYHMMAVGATRVYVKPEGAFNMRNYLDGAKKGRSFVSSGPQLDFTVGGVGPGEVVRSGQVEWKLDTYSAVPFEKVEILVNGKVVWSGAGLTAAGKKTYGGRISVPKGGWVAARVHGGPTVWPSQEVYPFAHTSPVWIGKVGSTDPAAVRAAANDLLRALDSADTRLKASYPGDTGQRLKQRVADARKKLQAAKASGVFTRS